MKKEQIAPNLYRVTKPTGQAYYIARFTLNGRRVERSLGNVSTMSVKAAKTALAALLSGQVGERTTAPRKMFAECALAAVDDIANVKRWRNPKSRAQWLASLKNDAFPSLGKTPIDKITRDDVLRVLRPIWDTKTESARRLQQRLSAVFDWAIVKGYRQDNPAAWKSNLQFFLPQPSKVASVTHHDAPSIAELRQVVAYCLSHKSIVSGALLFVIGTVCRVGECIQLTAEQIDGDTWNVPKTAQKTALDGRRVPLTSLALDGVAMGAKSGIVFTGMKGGAIAQDTARLKLQMILKRKTTVHGIRSTFRDWADSDGIRREVAESCLSHQVAGKVESAYLRKDFFDERKAALNRWKDTLVCEDDCK